MLACMTRFMKRGKKDRSRETHCKSARWSCEIDAAIGAEIETPLAKNCVSASKHSPNALLMNDAALQKRETGKPLVQLLRIRGKCADETPGDRVKRLEIPQRLFRGEREHLIVETWKRGNGLAEVAEQLEGEDLELLVEGKLRKKRGKQREQPSEERNARFGQRGNQERPAGEVEERLDAAGVLIGLDELGEAGHGCDLGQLGQNGL